MTRKAVETGALWKPWKNGDIKQTTLGVEFFHRSHNAWETPPDGVSHSSHRFYDEIHQPKNETPRLQKCNLCAREKLLPMNRELHLGILAAPGVNTTSTSVLSRSRNFLLYSQLDQSVNFSST